MIPDFENVLAIYHGDTEIQRVYQGDELVWEKQSTTTPYITFSSPEPFTLAVYNAKKNWDGALEYSTDTKNWTVWDGTTVLSSRASGNQYFIYLRGTGNTVITGSSIYIRRLVVSGESVSCNGDIRTLLDYQNKQDSQMAAYCFDNLFYGCTSLISAPALPATTLSNRCYSEMFRGCVNLTNAPALPADRLSNYCYYRMFFGCTSLVSAPELPATVLANECYESMFYGCTSLTSAPRLPATTMALACYSQMFENCVSLSSAPELPALELAQSCYSEMFRGCTSLLFAPTLPATTLAMGCYASMFSGCTSLRTLPALYATYMPWTCYNSMFISCSSIKLSLTQEGDYQHSYRLPFVGNGEVDTPNRTLAGMFANTGGTFTGTPTINTTYYTANEVV